MTDAARQVEALLYTYAERIDRGDFDGVAKLFAHGRIHAVPDAPPDAVYEGQAAVRGLYEGATRLYDDGTPKTKHTTTNAIIDVDEAAGVASARSYYTVTQATDELPLQIIITGRYHDSFQRLDDTWWFDTRVMFVDQTGDLSHHLQFEL
ncbi:MAG: nuclear transport factor 2 family protein [Acidimicrobiales bacterium]